MKQHRCFAELHDMFAVNGWKSMTKLLSFNLMD